MKDILRITAQNHLGIKYISLNFRNRWYSPEIEVGNFRYVKFMPKEIEVVESDKVKDFKYYELSGKLTIMYNPKKVIVVNEL